MSRTLEQLAALRRRWHQCPPADRLLAAFVGYKAPLEEFETNYAEAARRKPPTGSKILDGFCRGTSKSR